jgi:Leucine-rich repeat (LRR) protein
LELHEDIGNLVNLTSLNLRHNQLTSLPNSFVHLKQLSALDASHNLIRSIGNVLEDLPALSDLNLEANRLDENLLPPKTLMLVQKVSEYKIPILSACMLNDLCSAECSPPKQRGGISS